MAKVKCKHCNSSIDQGRSDKLYCDRICRAAYHNKKRLLDERKLIEINRILRKNRQILQDRLDNGEHIIKKSVLKKEGFIFKYFTQYEASADLEARYCYDLMLIKKEGSKNKFEIKKIED